MPSGLSGANVTIEAWVKIPAGNVNGPFVNLGTDAAGWAVGVGGTTMDNTGHTLILVNNGIAWHNTGYTLSTGTHHVMVVRGTGGAFTCYVDGASVATGTLASPGTATSRVDIGGSASRFLSSTVDVDNVALFASALSSTRVTAHYNSGAGDNAAILADSPTAFLKFDDQSDYSGNNRPLTHINAPTLGGASLLGDGSGHSISYNGSNQYSSVANAAWMNTNYASGVVRMKVASGNLTGTTYIASRFNGSVDSFWLLEIASGKVKAEMKDAGGTFRSVTGATTVTTGDHTIGWSFNGTQLKVYLDGVLDGTTTLSATTIYSSSGTAIEIARAAAALYSAIQVQGYAVFPTAISDADQAAIHTAAIPAAAINLAPPKATATALAPTPKPNLFLLSPKATATALALAASLTFGAAPLPFNPPAATATAAAPAPAMVVGPFGFAVPAATATAAAPAPTITFGAFEFAPPPAMATASAIAPSLNVAGQPLEYAPPKATAAALAPAPVLAIPIHVGPWTADLSRRTLLPFVTSGHASATPPLAVLPAWYTDEHTIMRSSKIVPDLSTIDGVEIDLDTKQLRLSDAIYHALPEIVGEVGVPHLIFHHHGKVIDATYFRDAFARILTDRREAPFGDALMSFELPIVSSMDEYPDNEDHPLWFLINRANVQIELVKSDGTSTIVWTGHVVATDTGNSETEGYKRIDCVGSLFQASTDLMHPPTFLDRTDIGTLMPRVLNAVTSRRFPKLSTVVTNIFSRQRGSWAESPLGFCRGLLATAWTAAGNQWTIAKVEGSRRTYEIRLKKTEPEWTVTNGAHGVSVDLTRDNSVIRNVIYGHGVGPDGAAWYNYKYPNLHADTAPAYPFADPDDVISVGTTDAETTSGHGVSDWQRRARELGYKLVIDGVFNTSDAEVARTIQRRFGAQVDGVVGPQTWNATFGVGSNAGDLSAVIRLPLAADPRTQRYLYNADGSVAGLNPDFDANVIIYADDVDFGTGITLAEGLASAQQIVDRESEPGLTGKITLTQDPREGSRMLVPPGDKITLIGYEGADQVLHIAAIDRDWQTFAVTLEVDSKSRDALTVAQIHARDAEARRDPALRPGNPNRRSRLDTDQVVPFDGESGAGVIPRLALFGGLWTVIRIPVSETGRVGKSNIGGGARFNIGFFGKPITPAHLVRLVGNPLTKASPYEAHEPELSANHWYIESFGEQGQRCGYYPGSEQGGGAFKGVEEQGGWEYTSSRPPWIWVAMFASESCFLEGNIWPDTVV